MLDSAMENNHGQLWGLNISGTLRRHCLVARHTCNVILYDLREGRITWKGREQGTPGKSKRLPHEEGLSRIEKCPDR